jgi:hypothetical protein
MQGNGINREAGFDMVFYADIVIEFVCFLINEMPVPFYIQVASFAKTAAANAAGKFANGCLNMKCIVYKKHILN